MKHRYYIFLFIFSISNLYSQQNKTGKPNVVFIISDQHKLEAIGAYGSKQAITPNIDELAKTGVVFNNCACCTASNIIKIIWI